MAVSLPYLASYKNVGKLVENIASAKVPAKFTHDFLQATLGIKGAGDGPLIPLLRHLGFIDQSGTPTASYAFLKNNEKHRAAIAEGIKRAYAPLFAADEAVYNLPGEKLRSLVSQVAGTDADMSARIANTFAALAKLADFKAEPGDVLPNKKKDEENVSEDRDIRGKMRGLRTEFQYNIQVCPSSEFSRQEAS